MDDFFVYFLILRIFLVPDGFFNFFVSQSNMREGGNSAPAHHYRLFKYYRAGGGVMGGGGTQEYY